MRQNNFSISGLDSIHFACSSDHLARSLLTLGFTVTDEPDIHVFRTGECKIKVDKQLVEHDRVTDLAFVSDGSEEYVVKSIIPGLKHTIIPHEKGVSVKTGTLQNIDHIAFVVESETAEEVCQWYTTQFGFLRLDDVRVKTEFNGLLLKVVCSENRNFYLVFASSLSEPDQFEQVKDFLKKNGSGLQHVAFECDIVKQVRQLKSVQFIKPPTGYYNKPHVQLLMDSFTRSQQKAIKSSGILVDHDECDVQKILMQVFTKPVTESGVFFELIERINQSSSFGRQNVKALFEGIEEQRKQNGNK